MLQTTYIYELTDGHYYYVGKANDPYDRLKTHIQVALRGYPTRKYEWVRQLADQDLQPDLNIIETIEKSQWQKRERYWIAYYRDHYGEDWVLNEHDGGNGPHNVVSGEDHHWAIYSDAVVEEIKTLAKEGKTTTEIAEILDLHRCYVYSIVTGRRRGEAVEEANIAKYLDEATSYDILVDFHTNNLDTEDLMVKYEKSRSAIRRAIFQEYFKFDEFPIPEKRDRAEQVNRGPYGAFIMRRLNSQGYDPSDIAEALGTTGKNVRNYLRNNTSKDENWDPVDRVYIGQPKGYEEDWGDW